MTRLFLVLLAFCTWAHAQSATPVPPAATPQEIELGKKAAAEFEAAKSTKLLDPKSSLAARATLDKLDAMVKKLGAVSPRPGINYIVRVVENKDVNAFTLPDGHIYVFRGLLDYAASDDELAGVLAHEIAHNTRMHALRGQKQAKKLNMASLVAMAAMLAGGRSGANVAQFSQYLLVGVLNGYGIGYEKEADASAVETMISAGYNPAALVTFMRRLQLMETRSPGAQLGIFQTHPPSNERADSMLAQLKAEDVEFNPRAVTGAKTVMVSEKPDRFALQIGDLTLLELAKVGPDAKKRAESAATKLNDLLRADLQLFELSARGPALLARGQTVALATPADLKLHPGGTQTWITNFQRLFWKERLNGRF
jgi:predicted Zn-dependent protease